MNLVSGKKKKSEILRTFSSEIIIELQMFYKFLLLNHNELPSVLKDNNSVLTRDFRNTDFMIFDKVIIKLVANHQTKNIGGASYYKLTNYEISAIYLLLADVKEQINEEYFLKFANIYSWFQHKYMFFLQKSPYDL